MNVNTHLFVFDSILKFDSIDRVLFINIFIFYNQSAKVQGMYCMFQSLSLYIYIYHLGVFLTNPHDIVG